jgi:hypothetical protein
MISISEGCAIHPLMGEDTVNNTHRTRRSTRWSRASNYLLVAAVTSVFLTGCATQSINAVTDLVDAARVGDTAAIERLTTDSFAQKDLAIVAIYALEGCSWKAAEASSDEVQGTFACPEGGEVASQSLVFTIEGAKVSSVQKLGE